MVEQQNMTKTTERNKHFYLFISNYLLKTSNKRIEQHTHTHTYVRTRLTDYQSLKIDTNNGANRQRQQNIFTYSFRTTY